MSPNSLPPKIVNDEVIFVRCAVVESAVYLGVNEHLHRKQGAKRAHQNYFLFTRPCSDASLSIIAWAAS